MLLLSFTVTFTCVMASSSALFLKMNRGPCLAVWPLRISLSKLSRKTMRVTMFDNPGFLPFCTINTKGLLGRTHKAKGMTTLLDGVRQSLLQPRHNSMSRSIGALEGQALLTIYDCHSKLASRWHYACCPRCDIFVSRWLLILVAFAC